MNYRLVFLYLIFFQLAGTHQSIAQDRDCEVLMRNLAGSYIGECKKGLAHGMGEAKGIHHYVGEFINGLPSGYGTYYYADSTYKGEFLAGFKEGKGQMTYMNAGADSVKEGYWSGNIFRGDKYVTYKYTGMALFDRIEIRSSRKTGKTITFDISTTSGNADGSPINFRGRSGYILRVRDLVSRNNVYVHKTRELDNTIKTSVTYTISEFPVILYGILSNGQDFTLELYRPANWNVRFYMNK